MMKSMERIYAMVLRYIYLLRHSWPRILELFYWPAGICVMLSTFPTELCTVVLQNVR